MKSFLLFAAAVVCLSGSRALASDLSPREEAVAIVARHLASQLGTSALAQAVAARRLEAPSYWEAVFRAAGRPELLALVQNDLLRAAADVPYVDGEPAPPDIRARALLHALGPLPIVPLSDFSEERRRRLLAFAQGPFYRFATATTGQGAVSDALASALVREAESALGWRPVTDGFRRLIEIGAHLSGQEVDAVDAKDRLNAYLHLNGLHLVIDPNELRRGVLTLEAYVVTGRHVYDVEGTRFDLYDARPVAANLPALNLGHAEVDGGFLFLFSNVVDADTQGLIAVADGRAHGPLFGQDGRPLSPFSTDEADAVDAAIRAAARPLLAEPRGRFRDLFVDSIGRHEGYHAHIEPALAAAVARGNLSSDDKATVHETGAYLYQLETSNADFLPMNLLLVTATAFNPAWSGTPNGDGARRALERIQPYAGVALWEGNRPSAPGFAALFARPPTSIKKAAGEARWDLERSVAP